MGAEAVYDAADSSAPPLDPNPTATCGPDRARGDEPARAVREAAARDRVLRLVIWGERDGHVVCGEQAHLHVDRGVRDVCAGMRGEGGVRLGDDDEDGAVEEPAEDVVGVFDCLELGVAGL